MAERPEQLSGTPEGETEPTPQEVASPPPETPPVTPVLSPIADDTERKLDPRFVTASRLAGGIVAGIFTTVSLIAVSSVAIFSPIPRVWAIVMILGWALVFGSLCAWAWFGPALRWRYAFYRVNDKGIQIREGIYWRSVVNVPKSRVQHTDVSQGPIARSFGLASLIIHTAGTQHASVPLSGIPKDVATQIRDHLIEGGEDDAV